MSRSLLVERAQLLQQQHAVADLAAVGRVREREALDLAEPERRHLQDHAGEARAQDLGVREPRALGEVLLGVQADADAVAEAPAAALALVGRGLRDRFDGQPLHLQARAVAGDPRGAGIDHVADAGDGERRLGDVGGEHDAAPAVALEDALLLAGGQARIEREQLDARPQPAAQRVRGVADLALAGEEHEHVARALALQLVDGGGDRVGLVVVLGGLAVADLDRIRAPGDLDHRRSAEVLAEALRVDRRGGHDQLQLRPLGQDALDAAEQEVDVQAALVRLVDDDRVVALEQPVALDLGEQQAVGHQPDQRVLGRAVVEPHRIPDRLAERHVELLGDPLGDRARREPARLRVRDAAADPAAELERDLRQLRRLARAGLAGHDDDLVVADRGQQLVLALGHREVRIGDPGDRRPAARDPLLRLRDVGLQARRVATVPGAAGEAFLVAQRQPREAGPQLGIPRRRHRHPRIRA